MLFKNTSKRIMSIRASGRGFTVYGDILTRGYLMFRQKSANNLSHVGYFVTYYFWALYAVIAQTSLAPLSWCGPLRLVHANLLRTCTNVSRFQSYAKSRRLHAIANEIDMQNLQSVNRIPGIHDNGPPRTTLWRLTLTAYCINLYHRKK